MTRRIIVLIALFVAAPASAQVRVNPNGVNVNAQGATTVFLTFGGLRDQRPAEAFWCGELVPAAPDIGMKCDPATVFGSLPGRFDLSTQNSAIGFTDIMSIPPSVARRAYQAAEAGQTSSFYYVRRFTSTTGGANEYVSVTCRMAGGGARVPLSLTDVQLHFAIETPILYVRPGDPVPPVRAEITYNGTGRLVGRWEVVLPGEEPPAPDDLLTEASLPLERRGLQRRYSSLQRFNAYLPPTGRFTLPGPDVARLPASADGNYLILLRVEASDDKEADSNLASAGAGTGIVHSGAVAGFSLPTLRYIVGGSSSGVAADGSLDLVSPDDRAALSSLSLEFRWRDRRAAALYRLEIRNARGEEVLSALVQPGVGAYRAPSWLRERVAEGGLRWRVVAVDAQGQDVRASAWRTGTFAP